MNEQIKCSKCKKDLPVAEFKIKRNLKRCKRCHRCNNQSNDWFKAVHPPQIMLNANNLEANNLEANIQA